MVKYQGMAQIVHGAVRQVNNLPKAEHFSTPWYFRHQDLIEHPDPDKIITQKKLINLWNHIHFHSGFVFIHLRDSQYQEQILVKAHPDPCTDDLMTCRWPEEGIGITERADILNVIISDGLSIILIPTRLQDVQKDHFTIYLPDKGYVLGQRQARRYVCRDVRAELIQSGFMAKGRLVDFSSLAFRVKVSPDGGSSFHWFNADCQSYLHLYQGEQLIFSGLCRCLLQTTKPTEREIVLAPTVNPGSRYLKKKRRNPRLCLQPLPNITFHHPFYKKRVQLDIHDLSTSGFSVYLKTEEDVLMPGMIIPHIDINYAGGLKLPCKAQVIYRRDIKKEKIHYGFVILDMDILTYGRLSHILMNVIDPNTHIADEVDADQLWKFLFETGFIYPKKYHLIQAYRESLKKTYQKLYRDNPEIAVQVTYQRNGQIYGHASMVRAYERVWMVHHLAARPLYNKRTGLYILKQIVRYFDGLYRLPSVGMDYMMFYYRPENQFPSQFFGGFARHLDNPRACSLDLFSYLSYPASHEQRPLPEGWSLEPYTHVDASVLMRFYRNASGGLLLDALPLSEGKQNPERLSELYARGGFLRSYESRSLKQNGLLKAVLLMNRSDPGLSLSEFLNGIMVLVNDATGLSWETLSAAISKLTGVYTIDKIPILIYPANYSESRGVVSEKRYNLWIMDVHHGYEYGEYMMDNTRLRPKLILPLLMKKYLKK